MSCSLVTGLVDLYHNRNMKHEELSSEAWTFEDLLIPQSNTKYPSCSHWAAMVRGLRQDPFGSGVVFQLGSFSRKGGLHIFVARYNLMSSNRLPSGLVSKGEWMKLTHWWVNQYPSTKHPCLAPPWGLCLQDVQRRLSTLTMTMFSQWLNWIALLC